jgi:hypothetical protein
MIETINAVKNFVAVLQSANSFILVVNVINVISNVYVFKIIESVILIFARIV